LGERIKFLKNLSRSLLAKEAYPLAIIVASAVTSDPIVHNSVLRSRRSRRKSPRKLNQALDLPRHFKLLSISGNNRDLFLLAENMARLNTTNPSISRRSRMSPTISTSMKGY
jgi:hypothetical protein